MKMNRILVIAFGFVLMAALVLGTTTLNNIQIKEKTDTYIKDKNIDVGRIIDNEIDLQIRRDVEDEYLLLEIQIKEDPELMKQTITYWNNLLKEKKTLPIE